MARSRGAGGAGTIGRAVGLSRGGRLLLVVVVGAAVFGTAAVVQANTPANRIQTASGGWARSPFSDDDPNVTAIAVDPSNAQKVYAGTDDNGLYKSTDAGKTFRVALPSFPTEAIAVDPRNPQTIYQVAPSS